MQTERGGSKMSQRKKYAESDYTPCCIYCEYALPKDGDDRILQCLRKRKRYEREGGFGCKRFRYDLLKHKPAPKKSPESIDEDLRGL